MFAKAYEIASAFTHPVIISARYFDGSVESGLAAMTILNAGGWAVTAAHIFDLQSLSMQQQPEIGEYQRQKAQIEAHPHWDASHKQREIGQLPSNPKWIINQNVWFGMGQGAIHPEVIINPEADLALIRLQSFDKSAVANYPAIKKAEPLRNGTSLCKLGFPLYFLNSSFDQQTNSFVLPGELFPIPRFPLEGMFTRQINIQNAENQRITTKFIETSSPGLRGQSGGPVFDSNGVVWGIQLKTAHIDLGFNMEVVHGENRSIQHQFLNVGWASHPETLMGMLRQYNVSFEEAAY